MVPFLDSPDLQQCSSELGCEVGQLMTPASRRILRARDLWGMDNRCYVQFDEKAFVSMLKRNKEFQPGCRFVAMPDIVSNGKRTLDLFRNWRFKNSEIRMALAGYPIALVMQDGVEDLDIPWGEFKAVFIGGSTDWKLSRTVEDVIKTAQILGKHVHVGRINEPARFGRFDRLGVDSMDGTGIAQYSKQRFAIWREKNHPNLFGPTDGSDGVLVSRDSDGLAGSATVLDTVGTDAEGTRGETVSMEVL